MDPFSSKRLWIRKRVWTPSCVICLIRRKTEKGKLKEGRDSELFNFPDLGLDTYRVINLLGNRDVSFLTDVPLVHQLLYD